MEQSCEVWLSASSMVSVYFCISI